MSSWLRVTDVCCSPLGPQPITGTLKREDLLGGRPGS